MSPSHPDPESRAEAPPVEDLAGCLLPLLWSMLLPGLIFVSGAVVALDSRPVGFFGDWMLLTFVLAAIAARTWDARRSGPGGAGTAAPRVSPALYAVSVLAYGGACFALGKYVIPGLS